MFNLKAANDLVIFTSQSYEAMHKGIASVKQNAPLAETVDLSAQAQTASTARGSK